MNIPRTDPKQVQSKCREIVNRYSINMKKTWNKPKTCPELKARSSVEVSRNTSDTTYEEVKYNL